MFGLALALSAFCMWPFIVLFLQSSDATGTTRDADSTISPGATPGSAETETSTFVAVQVNALTVDVPSIQSLLSFPRRRFLGSDICAELAPANPVRAAAATMILMMAFMVTFSWFRVTHGR